MTWKWLTAIAGALLAAFYALQDVLGPIIATNPKIALYVGGAVAFLSWLVKSPAKPAPPTPPS